MKNISKIMKKLWPFTPQVLLFLIPLLLCFVCFNITATETDNNQFNRWAIIGDPTTEEYALCDLLTAELSEENIELVDRKDIGKVLFEIARQHKGSLFDIKNRARLGVLLKADALLILSVENIKDKKIIKVVICESHYGTRLALQHFSLEPDNPEKSVKQIKTFVKDTLNNYSDGIQQIIGVADFSSKNLTHKYDYLQIGYTYLLQNALYAVPGTAVIEIDEARAIQKELAGEELKEKIPMCFVTGKYKTTEGQNGVLFTVFECKIDDGSKINKLDSGKLNQNEVSKWITEKLSEQIIKAGKRSFNAVDEKKQLAFLEKQADFLQRIGLNDKAANYREAMLLINPGNIEQRLKVMKNYYGYTEIYYGGFLPAEIRELMKKNDYSHPMIHKVIQKQLDAFRVSLSHFEYLIRNRKINMETALKVLDRYFDVRDSFHADSHFNTSENGKEEYWLGSTSKYLLDAYDAKRVFLENNYQQLCDLKISDRGYSREQYRYMIREKLIKEILSGWKYFYLHSDFVNNINYLFKKYLDTKTIPSYYLADFFGRLYMGKVSESSSPYFLSEKEWNNLIEDLKNSDSLLLTLYGRFHEISVTGWSGEKLSDKKAAEYIDKMTTFLDDFKKLKYVNSEESKLFVNGCGTAPAWDMYRNVERTLKNFKEETGLLERKVIKRRFPPKLPEKIAPLCEFVKIDIPELKAVNMLRCGNKTDVYWHFDDLYIMRSKGEVKHIQMAENINDLIWDGKYLWAKMDDGIRILSFDGENLSLLKNKNKLIPFNRSIQFLPVKPGEILATASTGDNFRSWIARIKYNKTPEFDIEILHEATSASLKLDDLYAGFCPGLIIPLERTDGEVISMIVERKWGDKYSHCKPPLKVDMISNKVSLFQDKNPVKSKVIWDDIGLRNGTFYIGLTSPYGMSWVNGNHYFSLTGYTSSACHDTVIFGDYLYFVTYKGMIRVSLTDFSKKLFPFKKRNLLKHMTVSSHYGLIAWNDDGLYRVKIDGDFPNGLNKNSNSVPVSDSFFMNDFYTHFRRPMIRRFYKLKTEAEKVLNENLKEDDELRKLWRKATVQINDDDERIDAVHQIAKLKNKYVLFALTALTNDDDLRISGNAISYIGDLNDERALPLLEALLFIKSRSTFQGDLVFGFNIRSDVISALSKIKDRRTIPPLIIALTDNNIKIRKMALEALKKKKVEIPESPLLFDLATPEYMIKMSDLLKKQGISLRIPETELPDDLEGCANKILQMLQNSEIKKIYKKMKENLKPEDPYVEKLKYLKEVLNGTYGTINKEQEAAAKYRIIELQEERQKRDKTIELLEKFIENKKYRNTHYYPIALGRIASHCRCKQNPDLEKAVKFYRKSANASHSDKQAEGALYFEAECWEKLKKKEDAIRVYKEIQEKYPEGDFRDLIKQKLKILTAPEDVNPLSKDEILAKIKDLSQRLQSAENSKKRKKIEKELKLLLLQLM